MSKLPATTMLLATILLAFLSTSVHSHGLMCGPRQRGAYQSDKCGSNLAIPPSPVTDHCAHCLNGGAVATVTANLPPGGWKVYEPIKDFAGTAKRAGLCGDAVGRGDHMIGGDFMPYPEVPIVEHYKSGGVVDFTAELDTNHNGYFEFFLCNLDKCGTPDISEKCFTGGHCHKLLRVPHKDCQDPDTNTDYECGPIDPAYLGRWYVPCRNTGHVGVHIVGGSAGTMRYQLPKGVTCNHCVVQWYWATANSCAPRGFLDFFEAFNEPFGNTCESDGGGRGAYRPGMSECGGDSAPEEFWSCADVQITPNGSAAGPVEAVGVPDVDPESKSNDEEAVKENPEAVMEKASEELEKDINMAANEETGEKKKEEMASANGDCLLEDEPCDAAVPCCNMQQVCVYTESASGFTCRFWWSLHKDVEERAKEE